MTDCPCITCVDSRPSPFGSPIPASRTYMVICPICGNKRCPHATHHDNACTGSNQPGQKGSIFENCGPHTHDESIPANYPAPRKEPRAMTIQFPESYVNDLLRELAELRAMLCFVIGDKTYVIPQDVLDRISEECELRRPLTPAGYALSVEDVDPDSDVTTLPVGDVTQVPTT